jgi:uncharacterized short protein YbdD (DUF466 family)
MRRTWNRAKHAATHLWRGLREWCGDSAYERYLQRSLEAGGKKPLTPAQFYVEQLHRKYSRPNRCC